MLRELAAGVAGFVVVGFSAVLVAGELWPSMRYEDALPGLLIAAAVGAAVAIWWVRRDARRGRR